MLGGEDIPLLMVPLQLTEGLPDGGILLPRVIVVVDQEVDTVITVVVEISGGVELGGIDKRLDVELLQ